VKFPKVIRHRKAEVTIYAKKPAYPFYRLAYRVDGKRRLKSFKTYSEAKTEAKKLAKEIAKGSPVAALSPAQARDAIAAIARLNSLYAATGRKVSLLEAVSDFAEVSSKLNGHTLRGAVEGFLRNSAEIVRKDISEAVTEFILTREPLTKFKDGKPPELSADYHYLVSSWLRAFAKTFPATSVSDLSKQHLGIYLAKFPEHSPKSKNHFRGAVKMFLRWCAAKDYLSQTHRLFEAPEMKTQKAHALETDFYRPKELQALLGEALKPQFAELVPVIIFRALAGLRLSEVLRLDWADVWRIENHVEIKAGKAKTRMRRLVTLCPSAMAWLEPYRGQTGPIYSKSVDTYHETFAALRRAAKVKDRDNGFRHGFCTYHFAFYQNENLTAAQSGNSPTVVHRDYKELATKADAEKWFGVMPPAQAANVIPMALEA
jgi:integrase